MSSFVSKYSTYVYGHPHMSLGLKYSLNKDTFHGSTVLNMLNNQLEFIEKYGLKLFLESNLKIDNDNNELKKYSLEIYVDNSLLSSSIIIVFSILLKLLVLFIFIYKIRSLNLI